MLSKHEEVEEKLHTFLNSTPEARVRFTPRPLYRRNPSYSEPVGPTASLDTLQKTPRSATGTCKYFLGGFQATTTDISAVWPAFSHTPQNYVPHSRLYPTDDRLCRSRNYRISHFCSYQPRL